MSVDSFVTYHLGSNRLLGRIKAKTGMRRITVKNKLLLFVGLIILSSLSACNTTESDVNATMEPGKWEYIVLGDSITSFYPKILKAQIEADFNGDVTIWVINRLRGGQTSSELLEFLQTDERLREEIQEAELITFYIPFGGCSDAMSTYTDGGVCGGEDNQDCVRECLDIYKADTTAIFAELVSLRSPSEALIRTHDIYQFYTSLIQEEKKFEVINSYWREANAHVHATAEKFDIPVANVYDAFMGEDGVQPPEENGLVVSDMVHTTLQGAQLIADLLHELGYELAKP